MFQLKFNESYKNVYWTIFRGQQDGTIKKTIMADIMRMQNFYMLIISVSVKIQLILEEYILESF